MKKTMYECDACGMTTENPHRYKMKEFFVESYGCSNYPYIAAYPATRKVKVHLCDGCYKSLQTIANAKRDDHGRI